MKPSTVVLVVILAVAALVGAVWIGRYQGALPQGVSLSGANDSAQIGPAIAPQGPYPKAVAAETEHNFGTMSVGEKGTHDFVIRNEGEADLEVMARKEDTTCQCTVGKVSSDGKIKPGESTTVTLNWEIKAKVSPFRHRAMIRTNDPDHKTIDLVVTGQVEDRLTLVPPSPWQVGEIASAESTGYAGVLASSMLKEFEIQGFECANPLVAVEWAPVDSQKLEEHKALSGYDVKIAVKPGTPVGPFRETITLKTSVPQVPTVTLEVQGRHPGPVEFFGVNYRPDVSAIRLGEFDASEGKEVTLSLFVREFDDELKLLDVKQLHDSVRLDFSKDPKFTGKTQRYLLKVAVPPGIPVNRRGKQAEQVDLFFNHPGAPQVRVYVDYLAK